MGSSPWLKLADELRATAESPSQHPAWSIQEQLRRAASALEQKDEALVSLLHALNYVEAGSNLILAEAESKARAAVDPERAS